MEIKWWYEGVLLLYIHAYLTLQTCTPQSYGFCCKVISCICIHTRLVRKCSKGYINGNYIYSVPDWEIFVSSSVLQYLVVVDSITFLQRDKMIAFLKVLFLSCSNWTYIWFHWGCGPSCQQIHVSWLCWTMWKLVTAYPGYFIIPVRVNWSAVKSYFSQLNLQQEDNSPLSAMNGLVQQLKHARQPWLNIQMKVITKMLVLIFSLWE